MCKISQNTQQLWQNRLKYSILTPSQSIFHVHKATMMVVHLTYYKQNPLVHLRYINITIQNLWNNGHKCYTFWHILRLITVPNMTKSSLFSEILQQTHSKLNIAIITYIWQRAQCYFICISTIWYLITVPNMNKFSPFVSEVSQQICKVDEKVAIITQIWHRPKWHFTSLSNASYMYLITLPNMKKNTRYFPETAEQTL